MAISNKLGSIFSDALAEAISKTTGVSLNVISEEQDTGFDTMVSFMSLFGIKHRTLFISAGEDDMRVLCSLMIGVPENEVTKEDMYDMLCELVNTTAGSAKLRLSDSENMFTLSPLMAMSGENMSVIIRESSFFISRTLGDGKVKVKLKVV